MFTITDTDVNVKEGIDGFVAGARQFDDITMLCLKYYGTGGKEDAYGIDNGSQN